MENDNLKENEEKVQNQNVEVNEAAFDSNEEGEKINNNETQELLSEKLDKKDSVGKNILASILDQLIIVACSSLLIVIIDLVMKLFGYMFIRENGALILAGGIIYFIINCFCLPLMEKTKLRGTIGKKILSI